MLDLALVGGGACGLALAHSLHARGRDWRLFEARERLGGRVLTAQSQDGTPLDLGATWYWPATQPAMAGLVADLGLADLAQVDDGRVLHLADPNRVPQAVALGPDQRPAADATATSGAVHGGARRLAGGMGALIGALARPLPPERLRLGHAALALVDHGEFIELRLQVGERLQAVHARHVVLALPPRVAESLLQFTPALPAPVQAALRRTPTWMATAAKAGFAYRRPFWREAGLTGNAWVTHSQAMLAEVFDTSGPEGESSAGALAGFAALGATQRERFSKGRELLLGSQMAQLFGPQAVDEALCTGRFWQDWAQERWTCSPADIAEEDQPSAAHPAHPGHPAQGEPLLAEPHWGGKLFFGGSETAHRGCGYLEGALVAAGRLRSQLSPAGIAARPEPLPRPSAAANDACAVVPGSSA